MYLVDKRLIWRDSLIKFENFVSIDAGFLAVNAQVEVHM